MSQYSDRVDVGWMVVAVGSAVLIRKIFLLKIFSCFVFVAVDI
jgi:hypothetical protein